jgi:hydrogenase maturation protease
MNNTPPTTTQILVAGIGNIFFGDDAFGSEVARALLRQEPPLAATVTDFGIRSQDLAYTLADGGYDVTILVDAMARGRPPGTLSLIEPDLAELENPAEEGDAVNAHGLDPVHALQMVRALGGRFSRIYLLACEPEVLETEALGLSETVQAAVPSAVGMIRALVDDILRGEPILEHASA